MPKEKPCRARQRFVPYAKGFRAPTDKQKEQAIGNGPQEADFVPDPDFFENIPRCSTTDDWLAQYKEEGQTYDKFVQECPWLSRRKVKYLKQVGPIELWSLLSSYDVTFLNSRPPVSYPHFDIC